MLVLLDPIRKLIMAAAYAALTSLINTIHQIQHHSFPPILLNIKQVESLTENASFLEEFLEGAYTDEANPLVMRIAEAANAAEDFIESHVVDMIALRRYKISSFQIDDYHPLLQLRRSSCIPEKETNTDPAVTGRTARDRFPEIRASPARMMDLNLSLASGTEEISRSSNSSTSWIVADLRKPASQSLHRNVSSSGNGDVSSRQDSWTTSCFNFFGSRRRPTNHGENPETLLSLYQNLRKVIKDMNSIKKDAMKMRKDKTAVVEAHASASGVSSSRSSITVGLDDVILEVLDKLTGGDNNRRVIPIVGMGGIGKTTIAKTAFTHALVRDHFDTFAWVTISQKYNTKEILCELLAQANRKGKEELSCMREDELELELHKCLSYRRFFVVLDDIWNIEAWEKIQRSFPNNNNSSRIVVTTRLSNLGSQLDSSYCLRMKFLDEDSSWDLFSKSVFGDESCPLELMEIGKEIVENCRGLPLAIVVVGGLLKRTERTKGCWESIRENSSSLVNSEHEDFCLKILKMSYNHLPVYLKPCFLYMGVFEEDRTVRTSTLVKLWVSEGFLKLVNGKSLETVAKEYLNDLVDRNLILVHELGSLGSIKYCKLHDLLRDLCLREAGKEGFYNVIGQHKLGGLNRQRRVVIPGRSSLDEVHDSALQPMPLARSFLCDSTQVLPSTESRLLRTLRAYDRDTSRSHDFSFDDLFQFVNLRYLAAGVHGLSVFPSSISLWNLQMLIILHCSWVIPPDEFWKMRQLRHVEVHKGGLELPDPPNGNGVMENLQTLKGVHQFDCEVVCRIIPNIKKLGALESMKHFNFKGLSKLESCSCRGLGIGEYSTFPYSLKKLSLGSYSSPWEANQNFLDKIGALPLLQKLKLEQAEFQSKVWETREYQFPSLKFLELKWCSLESWMTESSHFPRLEKLHLFELKELEEIPSEIGEIPTMQSILLQYCSDSVVESAKRITEEQDELGVRVVLFNKDNNQALRSLSSPNFLVEIVDL